MSFFFLLRPYRRGFFFPVMVAPYTVSQPYLYSCNPYMVWCAALPGSLMVEMWFVYQGRNSLIAESYSSFRLLITLDNLIIQIVDVRPLSLHQENPKLLRCTFLSYFELKHKKAK